MVRLDDTIKNTIRTLERKAEQAIKSSDHEIFTGDKIPTDPQEFFEDFGGLPHPSLKDDTGQPVRVTKLTPYQYAAWNYPGNLLVVKSNKIGLTTSFSLEDFHSRLLPKGAGYDVLLCAQTQYMADEHIRDLKKMIRNSAKYRKYLIERPDPEVMFEKSKKSVIYIRNPYNPKRPSRIIAIGGSEATAYSWKNVNHLHLSDVSLFRGKNQKDFFGGLYSRLANTNGTIKIESIPNGQQGEVWNIYSRSLMGNTASSKNQNFTPKFKIMKVTAMEAVKAELITIEFLEEQRRELGDLLYGQNYGCEFVTSGNQWYKPEWIHTASYGRKVGWY